jgi:hypothetical protein
MTPRERLALAVGVPGVLWVAVQGAILVGAAAGWRPLQPTAPVTLAELVVLGDHAGVVAAVQGGGDPNQASSIRQGIPLGPAATVTPLMAAVSTNQIPMIARLLSLGAVVHSSNYSDLVCHARRMNAATLIAHVEGLLPERPAVSCN